MNRQELEKMFDNHHKTEWHYLDVGNEEIKKIKSFIFDVVIPKTLKSIIPIKVPENQDIPSPALEECIGYNQAITEIINNAKKLFNINL